ncbi:MAG: Fmu (Sun) domain-containing protein [Chitinophagaceae bacterium]
MLFFSHLQTAVNLLQAYQGEEPFHLFIKKYFKAHPQHGSRDRRSIMHLCYGAFRLGKSAQDRSLEEQVLTGYFLCNQSPAALLDKLKPGWNNKIKEPLYQKLGLVEPPIDLSQIFPWKDELSASVDHQQLILSYFQQPLVFLRVRPGKEGLVRPLLENISHEWIDQSCVAVENNTRLSELLPLNSAVVVQDRSSQALGQLLKMVPAKPKLSVWDCCAASGGKTLLVADQWPDAQIAVSDIRPAILKNLEVRMQEAGVKLMNKWVIDLAAEKPSLPANVFDLIVADVPCTGSGTWGRNPEQLFYFEQKKITEYADLQARLLQTATRRLKPGGYLLYSTCSLFHQENEDQINALVKEGDWTLIRQELFAGYGHRADSLFGALLQRS